MGALSLESALLHDVTIECYKMGHLMNLPGGRFFESRFDGVCSGLACLLLCSPRSLLSRGRERERIK